MKQDCAIFISSSDGYSDAWEAFFILFFRYWPDCPFPVFLESESKQYLDPRVTTILVGADKKWATNTRYALDRINASYILYLQEDYLFKTPVDTARIIELIERMRKEDIGMIRLYPAPAGRTVTSDGVLTIIEKTDEYSVSLQAALWNKQVLLNLMVDGESGWDMEFKGSKRAVAVNELFLSIRKGDPAINYFCTAIKKGWWFRDAVLLMRKEGINTPLSRPVESLSHYWLRVAGLGGHLDRIKRLIKKML